MAISVRLGSPSLVGLIGRNHCRTCTVLPLLSALLNIKFAIGLRLRISQDELEGLMAMRALRNREKR